MVSAPSQERSRQKRDRLLGAAIELMTEGGVRAITHRAVAARAGVAGAATTYYFESIEELTNEALARHVEARIEELEALVADSTAEGESVLEMSERLARSLAARADDVVVAQFEVYLEAWRAPALRRPVRDALDAFEAMAAGALRALGVEDPERWAPAFVAAVDGFALHRLARPRPRAKEVAALQATLRALFVAAVMDDAEHAAWGEQIEARAAGLAR